ncbi:hypothetical protein [Streptomyces sp. NBC_01304]|uniref:hypothetical protein n=1 Tax=Streptomyces sp. NBC_01304 TaxID=2903818 RepID=UPI002E12B97B|nr:hypothetical protein OG430_13950 [Streptomyces sp. NBC_01304]
MLYRWWTEPARSQHDQLHHRAAGQALIHLRRTGQRIYHSPDHLALTKVDNRILRAQSDAVRRARRFVIRPGELVDVLGAPYRAVVVHWTTGADTSTHTPSIWYVAAIDNLQQCRAYGADDIEPIFHP